MNTFRTNLFDAYTYINKNAINTRSIYLSMIHNSSIFYIKHSGKWSLPIFTMIHNNPVKVMYVETKSLSYGLKLFLDKNE